MLCVNHVPRLNRPEIIENRVLAELPAVPKSLSALRDYSKKIDAYISDNFPARPYFIATLNYLRYRLGYSGTSKIFVGHDGWLFYDDGRPLDQARGAAPLPAERTRASV